MFTESQNTRAVRRGDWRSRTEGLLCRPCTVNQEIIVSKLAAFAPTDEVSCAFVCKHMFVDCVLLA